MIPNLINPIPCVAAAIGLIGIGGFPHSEIVGSMLAHSSPTLIAACHVLHRLYMPRHPRIALTSRLRVHTTNDITGCLLRGHQLGRAVRRGLCQVRMIIISARLFCMMMSISGASNRSSRSRYAEALTNCLSNPRLQNRAPHGIDFKKPIHNVKYGSSRPNHRALARRTVSLHL